MVKAINADDAFQFVAINSWPVSKINLETIAVKELPTAVAENVSYGMILNKIIQNSKVIRTLAGYEGCNALSYNLSCPDVIYSTQTHSEVFCQPSSTMLVTLDNP